MIKKSEEELRRDFHERLSKEKGVEYADAYLLKMKSTGTMEKVSTDFGRPRCSMSIEEQLRAENPDNPDRVAKLLKIWKRIR